MSLEIRGLSFSYGTRGVLNGLSAGPLRRGQVTALIGPNGSGKSTLFRCLAGTVQSRAGRVRLDDSDVEPLTARAWSRRTFHLSQDLSARAALSVFEVVLLARKSLDGGLGLRAHSRDLHSVREALEDLGIEPLSGRCIADLSGGQRQLVGIAQALVREPDVLLLDEPTSALDVCRQLEVMEVVRRLTRDRDVVTVMAMHDLSLAARFAEHLLLLSEGRITEEGAPEAVLSRPVLADTYGVSILTERSRRGSLLAESYLPSLRAAE
jgi:iron complex transport system ATP-binding protein